MNTKLKRIFEKEMKQPFARAWAITVERADVAGVWVCNGAFAVKTASSIKLVTENVPDVVRILPNIVGGGMAGYDNVTNDDMLYAPRGHKTQRRILKTDPIDDETPSIVAHINDGFYDAILAEYPNATVYIKDDISVVLFCSGTTLLAVCMPMRK